MNQTTVEQGSTTNPPWKTRISRAVSAFFFAPASARPLAALRVGLALVLLGQAWLLRGEVLDLLAHDGIVQGELARYLGGSGAPRAGWQCRFTRTGCSSLGLAATPRYRDVASALPRSAR